MNPISKLLSSSFFVFASLTFPFILFGGAIDKAQAQVSRCRAFIYPGSLLSNTHTWSDTSNVWNYSLTVKTVSGNNWGGIFADGEPVYGKIAGSRFTMRRDTWKQTWTGTCSADSISGTMKSTDGRPQTGTFSFESQ